MWNRRNAKGFLQVLGNELLFEGATVVFQFSLTSVEPGLVVTAKTGTKRQVCSVLQQAASKYKDR